MSFEIDSALGRFVIIEPAEKSTVLIADEVATIFKVVSIGAMCENIIAQYCIKSGDLIIVEKGSVQKTVMGDKDVLYVRDSDIIARVKNV